MSKTSESVAYALSQPTDLIESLYSQYLDHPVVPTEKQRMTILLLGGDPEEVKTSSEALNKIRYLIGQQPITPAQRKLVQTWDHAKIEEVLRREVKVEEMTRFDLQRVMNVLGLTKLLNPAIYNHPLHSTPDYDYGWQESPQCPNNRMYYLVFYSLLMVDIDGSQNLDMDELETKIEMLGLTARLYKTYNGYHAFVTSHPIPHSSQEALNIMHVLDCDPYYIAFAQIHGFKVRLNPKLRDDETMAAEYISTLGSEAENEQLVQFLQLHDRYVLKHRKMNSD
jgi:hypothetical protein